MSHAADENPGKENEGSISDWITGGPLGSKNAVLLFRSCVLAPKASVESATKTVAVGQSNGTSILLNKAKNMAKRLVAEPHSFNMRPKHIMHDVIETFGPNKYANQAFVVKHVSDSDVPETVSENEQGCEVHKRDIDDVLSDLDKVTLKNKNLNIENTTANIKPPADPPPAKEATKEDKKKKPKSTKKEKKTRPRPPSPSAQSDESTSLLLRSVESIKVLESSNMPARILKMTYKLVNTETKLLHRLLQAHGLSEAPPDARGFNLLWSGQHPKPDVLRSLAPYQRVNHFPRSYELTRKDKLFKNIGRMQYARGLKHFDFIPLSFLMPTEYKDLLTAHYRTKGPWIVKPAASSRGRGIYIVQTPEQIPKGENVVVAKYIDKPLLIGGHKCDLRLYVCVTSIDPLLIYLYEEGLVRFATVKYDTSNKNLWNPCMHLCNYSINKYHSDYIKCDDPNAGNIGHKWTLSALLRHLRKQGRDTRTLMAAIEELVVKSVLSSAETIAAAARLFQPSPGNCFELFGYDILIDEMLKPWLLEINLSPSLACESPLDARVKSALLADTLTLVGLPAPAPAPDAPPRATACRRAHSSDTDAPPRSPPRPRSPPHPARPPLTRDEARVVRTAREQHARRGGYVRIFPSQTSWQMYSQYLDPVTGIPVCSTSPSNKPECGPRHNYNLLLHAHALPPAARAAEHDRLQRYETVTITSTAPAISLGSPTHQPACDRRRAKQVVKQCLEDGMTLSPVATRRAFGLFLSHLLRRLSGGGGGGAQHAALLSRLLRRAAPQGTTQGPTDKMCDKDKCALVAKQLNDFLYDYYRETDGLVDSGDRQGRVPDMHAAQFLCAASEADLEEILLMVLRANDYVVPWLSENRPLVVDLPPARLAAPPRRALLAYLANLAPVAARRYRPVAESKETSMEDAPAPPAAPARRRPPPPQSRL
ncbi:hypothetical protein JYU34_018355 [Plutella xylostella]|uniref:Tubulin--tyrosine ligase-like protein 5 n=1 Tax=Plutella xylostella TaxID=51655 RepID=A0ABQ7PXC9_PLUXY|nr:hypothetical protein JYU34_018355 [Plutella xylostella]